MATEPLPKRIQQQATTVRFPEDLRLAGERIARDKGLKFADIVRLGLLALIRHEDKTTSENPS
jgi:hypothetical protein